MKNVTTKGTVKVGRWTYPAEQDAHNTIRNTKRDGSGEWVAIDAAAFVPDEAPAAAAKPAKAKAVDLKAADVAAGSTTSPDYRALRAVHLAVFNSGIWADTTDIQVSVDGANLTEKRALELVRYLRGKDLLVEEKSTASDGFATGKPMWSSSPNWDEVSEAESLALFDAAVPRDVVVKERKISQVTNNTHKKPGRSSWTVGDKCPQGHKLGEGDIYVMPSGRKQCQKCRKGYPSNI